MKKVIIADISKINDLKADLLSRTFPNKPDKKVFSIRDIDARGGYEIFGTKKDKTEVIVMRFKLVALGGNRKFMQYQIEYLEGLIEPD